MGKKVVLGSCLTGSHRFLRKFLFLKGQAGVSGVSWGWCHVRVGDVWDSAQAGGMASPRMASEVPGLEDGQRRELVP